MSDTIPADLAAPFDPSEVKWKPQAVSGNRALAIAYVNARVVMDRLDDVLGVAGWQDSYEVLPDGNVVCQLRCNIGGTWITKHDVGGQSEQPDEGDRIKSAFSDALKRAAVKFGVGRYLYRLPHQWVDWDVAKKQFVRTPTLPAWAIPSKTPAPAKDDDSKIMIGRDGAAKLLALALRKGETLASYVTPILGKFGRDETLTKAQARGIWQKLEALPDADHEPAEEAVP